MIIDVLVTDQLNLFIVFYETYGQPERRLCPLVVPYMAPGPRVQFFLSGGSFFVIWSARGMGPSATVAVIGSTRESGINSDIYSISLVSLVLLDLEKA